MKHGFKLYLFVFVLLATTLACQTVLGPLSQERVEGSGNLVEENRQVSGFDRVNLAGIGRLEIRLGEQEALRVEAEDNLQEHIITEVRGDTLFIGIEQGVNIDPTRQITYHLTATNLTGLVISGAGEANAPSLEAENFDVLISGAGNLTLEALNADTLTVDISGAGNLEIQGGQVERQDISISGSGSYNARQLESQVVDITISGLGSATVRVQELLNAEVSGSGQVRYIGQPEVNEDVSGVGSVEQIQP